MTESPKSRVRPKTIALAAGVAVVLVVGGVHAFDFLAPKDTTTVNEALDTSDPDLRQLTMGSFSGADRAHSVSGTATLYKDSDGLFIRFEDYQATSGPDVYFFVSSAGDGEYRDSQVTRLLVPGGAEDGQATLRGDFNVRLPAGLTASDVGSLIVWCDDFNVKFGHASLN
ncbi:MAG: DM13 domain-containing protein [Thermoplasmatota archaeon]